MRVRETFDALDEVRRYAFRRELVPGPRLNRLANGPGEDGRVVAQPSLVGGQLSAGSVGGRAFEGVPHPNQRRGEGIGSLRRINLSEERPRFRSVIASCQRCIGRGLEDEGLRLTSVQVHVGEGLWVPG